MGQPWMSPLMLLVLYCALILLASLAGGLLPLLVRLTHTRLQLATSFVAGFMLGIGLLHLLPHAWQEVQSIDQVALWLLAGFTIMFFIQRFFHFHHHDVPDEAPEQQTSSSPTLAHHTHSHEQTLAQQSARNLSWGGAALGLTLHTLIDGVAVAASVKAEAVPESAATLVGLGTFLVVILHKPFDAMAIGTLMAADGWSKVSRHAANGLFALAFPVGALLFHFGVNQFTHAIHTFIGAALAFSAGTFLCIAASDLLPELQFHSHDRIKLSLALLAGLTLSSLIGRLESSGHDRHQEEPTGSSASQLLNIHFKSNPGLPTDHY